MKPSLVFISPEWVPELDELLQITKSSFQIKVLTQKQSSIDFDDPYIEILQCFDTYSPLELAKLLPWLLQLNAPQFHVVLPENSSHKQLGGIGAFITMARAIPQSFISHSPWTQKGWSFQLWRKAFQNLFDSSLETRGRRFLTPTKENSSETLSSNNSHLELYTRTWVFPQQSLLSNESKKLIPRLLSDPSHRLEFWDWESLTIPQKNKMRDNYSSYWGQFQFHPRRTQLGDWKSVQFLVLFDNKQHQFSESDLIDLVIHHQVNIVMDEVTRDQLQGPWQEGVTFWLWHPNLYHQQESPWNTPQLSLTEWESLRTFQDQNSNKILRTLLTRSL